MYINDNTNINDIIKSKKTFGDTRIRIYKETHGTYSLSSEGSNKIVVAGSAFLAAKMINKSPRIWTQTYNDALSLENNNPVTDKHGVVKDEQVILFCMGDTGCGPEANQVFTVDYESWIQPDKLIPFVVRTKEEGDINTELRDKYFGRKVDLKGNILYYFKAFTSEPEIKQEFLDGTPIDENIYVNQRKDEVQSFIRYSMDISNEDFVKYWEMNNIDQRRLSSISLLTAVPVTIEDGNGIKNTYYQNIRPLTVYHFPREDMIGSKGLKIIYDQYL